MLPELEGKSRGKNKEEKKNKKGGTAGESPEGAAGKEREGVADYEGTMSEPPRKGQPRGPAVPGAPRQAAGAEPRARRGVCGGLQGTARGSSARQHH